MNNETTIEEINRLRMQVPLANIEQKEIIARLDYYKGNRTQTARSLNIGIRTLQRKLRSWGMLTPTKNGRPSACIG